MYFNLVHNVDYNSFQLRLVKYNLGQYGAIHESKALQKKAPVKSDSVKFSEASPVT